MTKFYSWSGLSYPGVIAMPSIWPEVQLDPVHEANRIAEQVKTVPLRIMKALTGQLDYLISWYVSFFEALPDLPDLIVTSVETMPTDFWVRGMTDMSKVDAWNTRAYTQCVRLIQTVIGDSIQQVSPGAKVQFVNYLSCNYKTPPLDANGHPRPDLAVPISSPELYVRQGLKFNTIAEASLCAQLNYKAAKASNRPVYPWIGLPNYVADNTSIPEAEACAANRPLFDLASRCDTAFVFDADMSEEKLTRGRELLSSWINPV